MRAHLTTSLTIPLTVLLSIALCSTALAQGRYAPQGAAQRHFSEGETHQRKGDALRDKKDLKGARKQWRAAVEAFTEAKNTDPAYIDAYVRLGGLYYQLKQPAKALPVLEAGLKQDRESTDLRFWYGQNLMRAGKTDDGVRALERVAAETERYPEVYVVLGNHYYHEKKFDRARPAYEQYLKLEPDATTARAKLGNTYFKLERYQDALDTFARVRKAWPDNVLVMVNIGNAHFQLGQYDRAVELLEAALKREPDRQSVHFNLAQSYFQLKRYPEAVQYYRRYIKNEPKSFNGNYFLGSALMEMGAGDDALVALAAASAIKPKLAQPHYKMGIIELRRGKTDAASKALEQAAKVAPKDPWVRTARGTVARQKRDYSTARKLQTEAVKMAPGQARLHANLALTELHANQSEAAENAINKALALDAEDPWIKSIGAAALGWRARALGAQPAAALLRLDRAIALTPKSAPLLASRALVKLALGRTDDAAVDAGAALQVDGKSGDAQYAMGRALAAKDQFEAAITALDQARKSEPNPATVASLAAVYVRAGKLDDAEQTYDTALKVWPDEKLLSGGRAAIALAVAAEILPRSGYSSRAAQNIIIALGNEDALSPIDAARVRYAALIMSLRKGDGKLARLHLTKLNAHAATARRAGPESSYLTRKAPTRHTDFLTAYVNMLLQNFDRAESLLANLRESRKRGTPEARLLRGVRERLGLAEFKKGKYKAAAKLLLEAQKQGKVPQTAHNLAVTNWRLGKKGAAEKVWRSVQDRVPEATFNLAVAMESAGKQREAYALYRRYAATGGPSADKAKEAADVKARIFGFDKGVQ